MRVALCARGSKDLREVSRESQPRAMRDRAEAAGETVVLEKVDGAVSHFGFSVLYL
ncbi:MAG TPA: hypothetical protein VM054_00765 [bacterium]|nr:hypothetical protein [bacterium]